MLLCKCGHENMDGGLFCSACGQKLEKICPACGRSCSPDARFCASCGAGLTGEQSLGQKVDNSDNVIAGDVCGSYNTNTTYNNNTSVVNNVYNQLIDDDVYCSVCYKPISAAAKRIFQCSRCGKYYCGEHMSTKTRVCFTCTAEDKESYLDSAKKDLKLHIYDRALRDLERAISEQADDPDAYYYAAIASFGGKKAFVQQRAVIDKAVAYLNAAIRMKPKGIYYYLLAYVKYDYFERKFLNTSPNYRQALSMAKMNGVTSQQIGEMYAMMCVPRPSELA